ncbi:hypothetical protein HDU67_001204 [Dinochytrium kinnereticum]|nr:hypothetical protein HDU67_001204 [Dinochytrium kinnereticum]
MKEETKGSNDDHSTSKRKRRGPTGPLMAQDGSCRRKSKKISLGYAPPETYAHLKPITDCLADDLLVIFIGINPGVKTALAGHAYAGPSNLFWPLLHSSGLTPDRKLDCTYDVHLPAMYSLGTTNLCVRPTRQSSELSKEEMEESVPFLEAKICKHRPLSVCFVGKGIWEATYRVKTGSKSLPKDFQFGWQALRLGSAPTCGDDTESGLRTGAWNGARVYVTPSTSGLVAGYTREFKHATFKVLGDWVNERRAERGEMVPLTPHPEPAATIPNKKNR